MTTANDIVASLLPTLTIPTVLGIPDYTMRVRLDGRDFNFRFLWNQRAARWTMDILDTDETPLAMGITIVCNWPMLRYYQWDPRLPPGEIVAYDHTSDDAPPPGLNEMAPSARVELTYHPATSF